MRGAGDILGTIQSGATLTPALGLPLTPAVLNKAKSLPDDVKKRVSDYFSSAFAPGLYADFTERVVRITLNS